MSFWAQWQEWKNAPAMPHQGEEIGCPHLHLYREGYNDRWAYPIPADRFPSIDDHFRSGAVHMNEIEALVEGYWRWLKDKTAIRRINDWAEITTPYLDRHNDYIQIYARSQNGGYVLTDGGETLLDLAHSGFSLDSPKRQAILKSVLNGFGIEESRQELCVHASADNFALRKHNLIQAILSVHDMFYLASPTVEALFFEDVESWLDLSEVDERIKKAAAK